MHSDEIVLTLLKLVCADCDEVGGGERPSKVRDKKHGKSNVERKEWLHAMGHVVWGVASGLASSHVVGPEGMQGNSRPT